MYNAYTHTKEVFALLAWDGAAIGRIVKEEREKRDQHIWSQRFLAEKAGVSHAYVSHLEAGMYKRPGREKVEKVFRALDLDLRILNRDGNAPDTDDGGRSEYPDLIEFEVMMLDTRRRDPRLARTIMKIARELIEEERRNRREEKRADENATKGGSSETT